MIIRTLNILDLAPSRVPPGPMPEAKLCQNIIVREDTSDQVVKMVFLEHDVTHIGDYKIYT